MEPFPSIGRQHSGSQVRRILKFRPSPATAVASAVVIATLSGIAYAAIPGSDGTVRGCYATTNGILLGIPHSKGDTRLVDEGEACRSYEKAVSWNQQGPLGDTGAQGPQGDTGLQGPTGPRGPEGPAGTNGADGTNGTDGAPGISGLEVVTGRGVTIPPGAGLTAGADCPAGKKALGGGGDGGAFAAVISTTKPTGDGNGWVVSAEAKRTNPRNFVLHAIVICANVG